MAAAQAMFGNMNPQFGTHVLKQTFKELIDVTEYYLQTGKTS